MTTDETLDLLGTNDWDEAEAPIMYSDTEPRHHQIVSAGSLLDRHLTTSGAAQAVTKSMHLESVPAKPQEAAAPAQTCPEAASIRECPLALLLDQLVISPESAFDPSAGSQRWQLQWAKRWHPQWVETSPSEAAVLAVVLVAAALGGASSSVLLLMVCLAAAAIGLLMHGRHRHRQRSFGSAFEQFHNAAVAYFAARHAGTQHCTALGLGNSTVLPGQLLQLRRSIKSGGLRVTESLRQTSALLVPAGKVQTDLLQKGTAETAHSLLIDLCSCLEVCSTRVVADSALNAQLRSASQQLASATRATVMAAESCTPPNEPCGSRQLVGLAAAAAELSARIDSVQGSSAAGMDPQAIAFLAGSMQQLQWWWQRVHAESLGASVSEEPLSTLRQEGEEGEDWLTGEPAAALKPQATILDSTCSFESAAVEEVQPATLSFSEPGALSLSEFDIRRQMVAAEMEQKLAAMRRGTGSPQIAAKVPAEEHQVLEHEALSSSQPLHAMDSAPLAPLATCSRPLPPAGRRSRAKRDDRREESKRHLESARGRMKETAPNFLTELSGRLNQQQSEEISDSDEIGE